MNSHSQRLNLTIDNMENARDERDFLLAGLLLGEIGRIVIWGKY